MNKITTKMKRHVRHELKYEGPTIWVGKEGFTPQVLSEVEKQLNGQKMVKVRILRSALQEEAAQTIANNVAQQTKAALVEVRGHVFILYRRRQVFSTRKPENPAPPKVKNKES